jgi:hypothetical protein
MALVNVTHFLENKELLITRRRINYNTLVYCSDSDRPHRRTSVSRSSLNSPPVDDSKFHVCTTKTRMQPDTPVAVTFNFSKHSNPHNYTTSHTKAAEYPRSTHRIFFIIAPTAAAESAVVGTATKETHCRHS